MAEEEKKEVEVKRGEGQEVEPAQALSPFDEVDALFDDYLSRRWPRPFRRGWPSFPRTLKAFEGKTPNVDVIDRDNEIVVKAELPGVEKKDVEVEVTQNTLSIKGTTSKEEKEEKGDYYRREISRGAYTRTLSLPAEIDEQKAKASFKDGVLELELPKLKSSKRQKVKID